MLLLAMPFIMAMAGCSLPPLPQMGEPPPMYQVAAPPLSSEAPPEALKPYYYPQQPITILVGSRRGADLDLAARLLAAQMEKTIQSPVIVSNKPGDDGFEIWGQLKSAGSDGYILGMIVSPQTQAMAFEPWRSASFSLNDYLPLAGHAGDPVVLFVHGWSTFNSLDELMEAARMRPGKIAVSVPYSSFAGNLAAEDFQRSTGLKLKVGFFTDPAATLLAALNGQVDAAFCNFSSAVSLVRSGRGRFLAVMSDERLSSHPSVPTLREKGINLVSQTFLGYLAPRKTAPDIADYLQWSLYLAISDPDHQAKMWKAGMAPQYLGSQKFTNLLISEGERIERLRNR